MRRALALVLVLLISGLAMVTAGQRTAHAEGVVVVTPGGGTQDDFFGFGGSDWQPGESIHVYFTGPEAERIDWTNDYDGGNTIIVDDDGSFALAIHPVEDFTGASFGTWTAHFETDRDTAATVDFEITP
jgi:hypothetical protein